MCCYTTLWNVNVHKSLYTVQSLMVSVGASKLGCTQLIFVDPGVKINSCYYREVLLSHQLLPAIWQVSRYLIQIIASFSAFKISQGSVATHFRWGGIFINNFIAHFLLNVSVKELWKSVNIQQRYGQEYSVRFFWATLYTIIAYVRRRSSQCMALGKLTSDENKQEAQLLLGCPTVRPQS